MSFDHFCEQRDPCTIILTFFTENISISLIFPMVDRVRAPIMFNRVAKVQEKNPAKNQENGDGFPDISQLFLMKNR